MQKIIYFLFVFCLFNISIFAQTADITQGCIPFEVSFTPPTGNTSFFWDFGNGTTSTLETPSSTFTSAGNFTVMLYDQPGGTLVGTVNISAFDPPSLEIFASPAPVGCAPYDVTFSYNVSLPQNVTILEHQWVFGDGGGISTTDPTVNYTFQNGGTYYVSLEIITDAPSCSTTQIFEDFLFAQGPPDSGITTDPVTPQSCSSPFNVTFSPTWAGATSYQWDFGNGQTSNSQNPPMQTYGEGNHTATLTVTDDLGCSSTAEQIISVGSPAPIINMPDTLCLNVPYNIMNGNPPLFYLWNFGSNASPEIAGIASPEVTFTSPGFQTITLTVTSLDQTCSNTVTKEIFIEEAIATFTTEPSFHCANPLVTTAIATSTNPANDYNWTFITPTTETMVNGQTVIHEFIDTSEFFPYSEVPYNLFYTELTVVTPAGCTATLDNEDDPDTIALYKANFFEDIISGCAPLDVIFTDSSTNKSELIQWEWFINDVLVMTNSGPDDLFYTFQERGEYEVYLVVSSGNPDCPGDTSAIHTIEVGELYNLNTINVELECTASPPYTLCPGDRVFPCGIPGSGLIIDGFNVSHVADTIIIEDNNLFIMDNGCVSETDFDIEVVCPPLTYLEGPEAIMDCTSSCEDPYTINVSGINSINTDGYTWNFGDGTTSNSATTQHTYSNTGDFYLTFTASNSTVNCPDDSISMLVRIRDIEAILEPVEISCSLDTTTLLFDATPSIDVHETCRTGYNWDFLGDELPPFRTEYPRISEQFPPSTFDSLVLITTDINGCKDTTGIRFSVYGADMEIGIDDHRICNDQEVAFTNLSQVDTTIASIAWSFGDGNSSTEENPTHFYTDPPANGIYYYVNLEIVDALGCLYQTADTITYYDFASAIQSAPIACQGQSFTIYANDFISEGSFLNYEWDFGNGTTGTGQTNDVIYNDLGFHDIVLNYEEESSGCSRTASIQIEVVPFPEASFISDNDDSDILCYPANVFFTNTSVSPVPVTYFWDFGNGNTSVLENPATVFEEGEYTVKLVITNELGCQDSISRDYIVLDPTGSFTVDQTTICKGDAITFQLTDTTDVGSFTWDFGDGVTIDNVNPITHNYNFHPPSGTTVATLVLYSEGGYCPFSIDTAIYIQEVIANFQANNGIDTAICMAPYPFTNLSQNADSYLWNFGDGTSSTDANPIHEYAEPGTYEVTLSIDNNALACDDVISYTVILHPNPNTNIQGDTLCSGEEVEIEIENYNSTSTYTWSPQELINTATDSSIFVSPTSNAIINLMEETEFGCTGEDNASILTVQPNIYSSFDTTIVIGDSIVLPVEYQDYFIFEWNPEEGLSCTDCSFPVVGPLTEDAIYNLNITDIYGCFNADLIFNILVNPETFINMPTTFTPNNDGVNDEIPVFGWGIQELEIYQIFNRWGEKVFETTDIKEGWDGRFKGVLQNPDVYAFKIKATDWKGEEIVKEGFINLVR